MEAVAHFVSLCKRVQGGGDKPAQLELVRFRETGSPDACLRVARGVLEDRSVGSYVHFEALSLLESAVLRQPNAGGVVLKFLLDVAVARAPRQERALTRKFLHVAAVVYKRCFQPAVTATPTAVDCGPNEFRESLWSVVNAWMSPQTTGPKGSQTYWEMHLLGLELIKQVLGMFLPSSPALGLMVDYAYRCHCAFEELYLRRLFLIAKHVVEEGFALEQLSPAALACVKCSLDIMVDVLMWNWNASLSLSTFIWTALRSLNERTTVSTSDEWTQLIRQPVLFEMFIGIFKRFRLQSKEIAHLALRGLEQMASFLLTDKVLSSVTTMPRARASYIEWLCNSLIQLLGILSEAAQNNAARTEEVFQASNIVCRMASNQHVKLLMFLPGWPQFLQTLGMFTDLCASRAIAFGRKIVSSRKSGGDSGGGGSGGAADDDDEDISADTFENSRQMASFSSCLHAWSIFAKYAVYRTATDTAPRSDHPDPWGPQMNALKDALARVYSMYVRTRLTICAIEMEAGIHERPRQIPRPKVAADVNEDLAGDESIVEGELSDQLLDGAMVGRACLQGAVPLVGTRLKELITTLGGMELPGDPKWLYVVEETHLMLLIAGHLVADSSEWELQNAIPRIISMFETSSNGLVVKLIHTAFSLLEWENRCFQTNRTQLLSPLLSATLLWFCDRVVRSYFFRVRRTSDIAEGPTPRQDNTSESFINQFGSLQLYNQFVELVLLNLQRWRGNDEVLVPTVKLLRSCCAVNRLSHQLTPLPGYQKLLSGFTSWTLDQVHSPIHRKVVACLFMARMSDKDTICEEYYANLLNRMVQLANRVKDPAFPVNDEISVKFCAALLEKLNGIVDGTTHHNVSQIRMFFFSLLPAFSFLMETYKNDSTLYVPLVRLCTRFVSSQADHTSTWVTADLNRIFDMSMAVLRFCRGGPLLSMQGARWTKEQECEQYQLLRRLILLLMALLNSVTSAGASNQNRESQADVILFGLAALLTHISEPLLDYPKLRASYYQLLKRLLNVFPERFGLLPPALFQRLISTLHRGLTHPDEKVQRFAVKGLKELFSAQVKHGVLNAQQGMSSNLIGSLIFTTLQLLVQSGSITQLLPGCAVMLLALIVCDANAFTNAVQQLVSCASSPQSAALVRRVCTALMDQVQKSVDKDNQEKFRENVKRFTVEIRAAEWK